jgi:NADH-quinone oxidoreductase subunit M
MSGALLSWMVFLPAAGALGIAALPPSATTLARRAAVAVSLLPMAAALCAWALFDPARGDFQLVERAAWVPRFGISYYLGIDGISLLLISLTVLLTPLVLISAADSIHQRMKAYVVSMLLLETAMLGTLVALDTMLFYVFWELMLVPMFLIIGVWGGERRVYAAVKFLLFTLLGSLPMLAGLIYLAVAHARATGHMSFALTDLYGLELGQSAGLWTCLALVLAFAVKVPMWPLHTWLPDAHVEAPTGGSVILAGVLLKMGTYGFVRFVLPLFPSVLPQILPWIAALAVVGIVYGALVAMVQPDMKKLVAYSSVSHLGFVMLGLSSLTVVGTQGAVYQMVGHGLSTGALFLLVGMIYERRHTRLIAQFGGLWKQMPGYAVCFLIIMLASIGLPGLNGFVGEFLILLGAFRSHPALAACAASGVVLGAVYMLWMYQRVMFGALDKAANTELADVSGREILVLAPLLALVLVMGVYPGPFLKAMEASVETSLQRAGVRTVAAEQGAPDARGPAAERWSSIAAAVAGASCSSHGMVRGAACETAALSVPETGR